MKNTDILLTKYSFTASAMYSGESVNVEYDNLSEGEYSVAIRDADDEIIYTYESIDYESLADFLDDVRNLVGQEIVDLMVI